MSVFDDVRKSLRIQKRTAIVQFAYELKKIGRQIIAKASATNQADIRTGNQEDAYGYAVFYNGKMVGKSGRAYGLDESQSMSIHAGWKKHNIKEGTGRDFLYRFYRNYKPNPVGFELVVVNAAFYSQILEDGKQSSKRRKYRIISQIGNDVYALERKFKGAKVRIISPVGNFG